MSRDKQWKKYFKQGDVSKWWDPEATYGHLRSLYIQQRFIVRSIFNPMGKKIIDVGTGKGRFAIDFALAGAKQIVAVDISNDMIKIAREKAKKAGVADRIVFQIGDAENLAFDDDIFDFANCMETLVHVPDPQQAINELGRVVKHGGIITANMTTSGKLWRLLYQYDWSYKARILGPIYFSKIFAPLRAFFHRKLGTPLTTNRYNNMSEKEFCYLFTNARLKLFKTIKQGPYFSPIFVIFAAKKP